MSKKFKYDGKSRPPTKKYVQEYNRIFGKKLKKNEELEGYYIDYDGKIQVLTKKIK